MEDNAVYSYDNMSENINNNDQNEQIDNNEQDMLKVYELVDTIPLTRPKKNIAKDFADGVLIAEIIKFFKPTLVEIHNYPSTNNLKNKKENWITLNRKVFKKLNFQLSSQDIDSLISATPGYIEGVLLKIFESLTELGVDVEGYLQKHSKQSQGKEEKVRKEHAKYHSLEEEYKHQLIERDEIINELQKALTETEKNLKISEENKKILNHQLETLKKKIKELGLY